jgi:hypothetical protein
MTDPASPSAASRADLPEPRTKAGQEMESWLREPEDYEWGRKVTNAILAIENEAAAPAPLSASPIVHLCPPEGSGIMPCCGRTPFEATDDRMTLDPALVTCRTEPQAEPLKAALERIEHRAFDPNDECRYCGADIEDAHDDLCPYVIASKALDALQSPQADAGDRWTAEQGYVPAPESGPTE